MIKLGGDESEARSEPAFMDWQCGWGILYRYCCSCSWNISFSAPVELKRQVFECMQVLSLDTGSNCPRPWNNFCTWIFSYPPPMKFKWGVILVVSPCLSVHPSVDEIVSVLLFCIFCNTSWIHFIYTHLISQLQMCHMCNFFLSKIWIFVDFFFFTWWLKASYCGLLCMSRYEIFIQRTGFLVPVLLIFTRGQFWRLGIVVWVSVCVFPSLCVPITCLHVW